MKTGHFLIVAILLLPVVFGVLAQPKSAVAAVCPDPSACAAGYSCKLESSVWKCVEDCTEVGASGDCAVDQVVVTVSKKMTFQKWVDGQIVPFVDHIIMPLLYALAFLLFMIGMVRFFFLGGDEGREKGKSLMLWGIIGLFVLFSVWGLVRLLLQLIPGA